MLGFEVAQSTVSKYIVRDRNPPSQTWKTFLRNHAQAIAVIDMCVVPTLTFYVLFSFLVLGHGRRQLLWIEVARHPTAECLARQITKAFPWSSAPTYLVRDKDLAYGHVFTRRLRAMGISDRPTSHRSPWQNGHVERLIGSMRCECLDQMLILGERHSRCALVSYPVYYNQLPALSVAKRCAVVSSRPAIWHHCTHSDTGWIASLIRPDMIFGWDNSPNQHTILLKL